MRLDRAWIERHIPHHGRMCLLDEVIEWNAEHIRCRSGTHRMADHPLRSHGRLGSACGIEYAAQAMAVHGALAGGALAGSVGPDANPVDDSPAGRILPGEPSRGTTGVDSSAVRPLAGFLASVREVRLGVLRLDDVEADLICEATRVAGDGLTALYEFALWAETRRLLSGRATVVLDANKRLNL